MYKRNVALHNGQLVKKYDCMFMYLKHNYIVVENKIKHGTSFFTLCALREKPLINIDSQTTMTFCWRPCMYNSKRNCQHGHESLTLICSLSPKFMHIGKIQTTDKTGYLVALLECLAIVIKNYQYFLVVMGSPNDDVIKWKHFPRYWPFLRGIHRWPVNSPHKGQWRRALIFSLICAWINDWIDNREAGDLRRHRPNYDFIVMFALCRVMLWFVYVRFYFYPPDPRAPFTKRV